MLIPRSNGDVHDAFSCLRDQIAWIVYDRSEHDRTRRMNKHLQQRLS